MDSSDRERPTALSRQQRRMFVTYWAAVGVIASIVGEALMAYLATGSWGIDPLKTTLRCIGMAITVGGAFWILTRPTEARPEPRA